MTRIGVLFILFTILLGPLYTEVEYEWFKNSISELAAQNTKNAWIMRTGLIALGAVLIIDYFRNKHLTDLPFAAFGLFIALSAVFPHRPYVPGREFNETVDSIHSILANLTGFSAVLGFILKWIGDTVIKRKILYLSLAIIYTVLPLMMIVFPEAHGFFQRIIFFSFFVWAWCDFPSKKTQLSVRSNI